jgi:glycosyl transferase family 25
MVDQIGKGYRFMEKPSIPVFVVALPKFTQRYRYINSHLAKVIGPDFEVVGVDGRAASPAESVAEPPLRPGQVGCALSHLAIYRRMVERDIACALVVEDDVILPDDIAQILAGIVPILGDGEVIQLYNWKDEEVLFSRNNAVKLSESMLYYPIDANCLGTTAAYVISRRAAAGILRENYPVKVTADNWEHFFANGAFETCRVMLPSPVRLMDFETTVFTREGTATGAAASIRAFARTMLQPLLTIRRRLLVARRKTNAVFTSDPSIFPVATPPSQR